MFHLENESNLDLALKVLKLKKSRVSSELPIPQGFRCTLLAPLVQSCGATISLQLTYGDGSKTLYPW